MKISHNELFNSFSHLTGAVASIIVTIAYILASYDVDRYLMISVFLSGISYAVLFISSFIHHATKAGETETSLWLKLDHSAIFIMMAGSYVGPLYIYAPLCMISIIPMALLWDSVDSIPGRYRLPRALSSVHSCGSRFACGGALLFD
ncbi:MAG: hypothetical protein A2176_14860 [Spirochaetes bacterium RBG_13_51_14]|nr:MAG: hypothetical protein A2176_14860 [Spirochaetes bacterium RBG_13_51_14]